MTNSSEKSNSLAERALGQTADEFAAVCKVAMGYLAAPHTVPTAPSLDQWRYRLRLWHYPSFHEYRAWGIYQFRASAVPGAPAHRAPQSPSLVRQVVWDHVADQRRRIVEVAEIPRQRRLPLDVMDRAEEQLYDHFEKRGEPQVLREVSDPPVGLRPGFRPQPTIEVRDRPLDSAGIESRLARLRAVSFPAFVGCAVGLDGERFGVVLPEDGANVEWWWRGPDSWRDLTYWAAELRAWLEEITTAPPHSEV